MENLDIEKITKRLADATGAELYNDLSQFISGLLKDKGLQPCGHPLSAIVHNGTTNYCGQCADDSLRENINKGIEA